MKILIITNHYLDDNNGGANNTKAYLRALGELYSNCTLVYPRRHQDIAECFIPPGINAIPVFDERSRFRKGLDVYKGILTRMPSVVKGILKKEKYDVIFIDHSIVASGLFKYLKDTSSKIVTIHHNFERQYLHDNKPELLIRYPKIHYAIKAERMALQLSNLNITLTERDATTFKEQIKPIINPIVSVGTFQYENLKTSIEYKRKSDCEKKVFIITGSLCFPQSVAPVVEFIRRFFPIILSIIPEARLIIAGRDPSSELVSVCHEYDNIELISNPKHMQNIICRSDVYVCPINKGSGVKLRIMDGLRFGLCVLTHEFSISGYEQIVQDGCMFVYHDEESFIKALKNLLHTNKTHQEVYDSFLSFFSYEAGKSRLEEVLKHNCLL